MWSGQIGEREGVGAVFSHPISITFSVMKVSNHYIFETYMNVHVFMYCPCFVNSTFLVNDLFLFIYSPSMVAINMSALIGTHRELD